MGEKQTKILRGKHKETSNKYLPVNSNLFVLYYFCLVLVFEARILRALWTMISEDKENMWTSNLLKKSNNDNSAVVVAFASNNNIKQHQTQFKYKISVLHLLFWVPNTQRFIHYKKSWKLKSSISERISFLLKGSIIHRTLNVTSPKKKTTTNECYQCSPFYKRSTVKVRICMGISCFISLELRWYCIRILVHLFCFHFRVQER